ncbi:hypothetical protein A2276_03500 [candidate division WOR-1 bacterium RIFOXYA12_FULL_43_27]|uniref:Metallo-beta-lactamase domain-containing protein n=1 Tax=candidate division WOR-1 bacterium RIFOXYC2_FULL_46_14 TaxID=1802587 RepID=A0A1F4U7A1_UNCSA|nr:MAG: hypothetical protein A2276_03500 [candidate division WOR-1 bacterium RIFOXYA12_FULL_43_27]OGC19235.1 MAG: hypothetical protein A2292_00835 [candidate division WOR-1 bacterium RIFOXYB2_FULL_46_45]OGC30224.1 MAG: hypothetical protein A2232_00835 [candidate division WOR-1 bacterium RIFOXYA2_FULL_46_56]OGC40825.1 MAG: hypothetical protein A2438_00835 [candidate division WOR-1 bacterium RIFOXYC2_FULL_46_14]
MKIKIIYENNLKGKGLRPGWGFAAVIEFNGKTILFDTGGKADILLSNMKALHINPQEITDIFISHIHWDHTGGLFGFLKGLFGFLNKNHKVNVYVPASFSDAYCGEVKACGARCVRIKGFKRIAKNIYSSGEMGTILKEQFLIIDAPEGLAMITGCSHPGIVAMVELAKKKLNKKIDLVLGGFHLYKSTASEIKSIKNKLRILGVRRLSPCHCSGGKAVGLETGLFKLS